MKMKREKSQYKNKRDKLIVCVLGAILLLYALSIIFVLGWGVLTSFKSRLDFFIERNVLGFPDVTLSKEEIRFGNYLRIIEAFEFDKSVKFYSAGKYVQHVAHADLYLMVYNTFLYAVVGSLLQAIVPAVCAYLCAKFNFAFSKFAYTLVLFVMIIPIVGAYPAEITLLRDMGLYDTFLGYFFQKFNFTGMYFFVYFAFYETMPNSYAEAAEIDGANRYQILLSIVIPLSVKIISTVWLLQFVHFWNDYQTPLLYMPTKPTLAYGIYYLCHETARGQLANVPAKAAGCMILAVPLICLFIAFKEKLMGNISMGGIKG